jgi:hypothetical protein
MRTTIRTILLGTLAGFSLQAAAGDFLPPPFRMDPSATGAFPGRETMEVYLVWDSDVIDITFGLPETETGILALDVGEGCPCTVTQHHGEQVAVYVFPSGDAVPFPPGYDYWSRNAVSGTMITGNVPASGAPEYGAVITVVLDGIDFGDGERHSFGPIEVLTTARPR